MSLEFLGVCSKLASDWDQQCINIFFKSNENFCLVKIACVHSFASFFVGEVICLRAYWIMHKLFYLSKQWRACRWRDGSRMPQCQTLSMVVPERSQGFEPLCPVWAHGMWTRTLWPGRANPAVVFRRRLPALWAEPVLTSESTEHIPTLQQLIVQKSGLFFVYIYIYFFLRN